MTLSPFLGPKSADGLLAQELNDLSMKERERVYYDVHGVADVIEETPVLIKQSVEEMDAELSRIDQKQAYDLAKFQDVNHVENKTLLLKFLRAECFDIQRAADRLVKFFQTKLDLFGQSKLTKEIRLADLDEADHRSLDSGSVQLLPHRDRAGRALLGYALPLIPAGVSIENRVRPLLSLLRFCLAVC
jgi:hypothetical protein